MKRIVLWLLSTVSAVVLLFGYHTSTSGPGGHDAQTPVGASLAPTTARRPRPAGPAARRRRPSHGHAPSPARSPRPGGVRSRCRSRPTRGHDHRRRGGAVPRPATARTSEINSYALPILVQETLDAQSADIDMVSGATVTSEGYLQSLQTALDQAEA